MQTVRDGAIARWEVRRPRFVDGLAAPWRGLGFVMSTPSVWALAAVPALVLVALFVGLAGLGVWAVEAFAAPHLASWISWSILVAIVRFVLWLAAVLVAGLVALSLAQPLSGAALEAIARRQGQALGAAPLPDEPFVAGFTRSLRITTFGLLVTLPIVGILTLLGVIVPPATVITVPLKLLVSALMLAWDVFDYPLSIRAAGVRARLAWFARNFPAALGFGASLAVISLVPLAGLLFLPAGIAGATRLVAASEGVADRIQ